MKSILFLVTVILVSLVQANDTTNTEVTTVATNYNLKKVLRDHEDIMMKLINEVKKMEADIERLQKSGFENEKEIKEMQQKLQKINIDTVDTKIQIGNKYDEEFKKYLRSND